MYYLCYMKGTTPANVNKRLQKMGIDLTMYRHASGYYYFIGQHNVESIYTNNLNYISTDRVIEHVQEFISKEEPYSPLGFLKL